MGVSTSPAKKGAQYTDLTGYRVNTGRSFEHLITKNCHFPVIQAKPVFGEILSYVYYIFNLL